MRSPPPSGSGSRSCPTTRRSSSSASEMGGLSALAHRLTTQASSRSASPTKYCSASCRSSASDQSMSNAALTLGPAKSFKLACSDDARHFGAGCLRDSANKLRHCPTDEIPRLRHGRFLQVAMNRAQPAVFRRRTASSLANSTVRSSSFCPSRARWHACAESHQTALAERSLPFAEGPEPHLPPAVILSRINSRSVTQARVALQQIRHCKHCWWARL